MHARKCTKHHLSCSSLSARRFERRVACSMSGVEWFRSDGPRESIPADLRRPCPRQQSLPAPFSLACIGGPLTLHFPENQSTLYGGSIQHEGARIRTQAPADTEVDQEICMEGRAHPPISCCRLPRQHPCPPTQHHCLLFLAWPTIFPCLHPSLLGQTACLSCLLSHSLISDHFTLFAGSPSPHSFGRRSGLSSITTNHSSYTEYRFPFCTSIFLELLRLVLLSSSLLDLLPFLPFASCGRFVVDNINPNSPLSTTFTLDEPMYNQ